MAKANSTGTRPDNPDMERAYRLDEFDRKLHQLQALIVSASMTNMDNLGPVLTPAWHSLASDLVGDCCRGFEGLHPTPEHDASQVRP